MYQEVIEKLQELINRILDDQFDIIVTGYRKEQNFLEISLNTSVENELWFRFNILDIADSENPKLVTHYQHEFSNPNFIKKGDEVRMRIMDDDYVDRSIRLMHIIKMAIKGKEGEILDGIMPMIRKGLFDN